MNPDKSGNRRREAIAYYHDVLSSGGWVGETHAFLMDEMQRLNLTFGERPVCTVLRPFLLESRDYEAVKDASRLVLGAIHNLYRALLSDDRLRAEMDLTELEEQVLRIEPGFSAPDVSSRLDGFLDEHGEIKFVEYNAESPGGLFFGDVLSDLFLGLPVMRRFGERYPLTRFPIRRLHVEALLDVYREWGGRETPTIAIVDWRTVKTYNEFLIYQEHLASSGIQSVIVDPEEMSYVNGRLYAGDRRVHLVYKRVVTGELLDRFGLAHPLFHAAREGAVCVANSFHVQMLYKKALFALLSDPTYRHLQGEEERIAIGRYVPWTRKLREGTTTYRGDSVDLLEFVNRAKDWMVIKPNGEYGGRGVVLGWECDQATWAQALADALPSSYVVQEGVAIGQEPYPTYLDGQLSLANLYFDVDPYVWKGIRTEGCGVRLSPEPILNVSAGGGSAVPMFLFQ